MEVMPNKAGKKTRRNLIEEWRKRHQERANERAKRYWQKMAEKARQKETIEIR